MGKHALVFGASGINGWAVVNELLRGYPDATTFDTVTALTNRPLDQASTLWPTSDKLQLVSGIDLLEGSQAELQEALSRSIQRLAEVTHVYFNAYVADWDAKKEVGTNTRLIERSIVAIEGLSKALQFVVLTTGQKVLRKRIAGYQFRVLT